MLKVIARSKDVLYSSRTFPGKRVGLEGLQGLLAQRGRRHLHAPAQFAKNRLGELRHVLRTLAQGRYAQLDHIHPIKKVLTKFSIRDQFGKILVRGRQYAHVDADFPPDRR